MVLKIGMFVKVIQREKTTPRVGQVGKIVNIVSHSRYSYCVEFGNLIEDVWYNLKELKPYKINLNKGI